MGKDLDWQIGQAVTFKVTGKWVNNGWQCSGLVKLDVGNSWQLMATFFRKGQSAPFNPNRGFYSFVEDWNRCDDANGHEVRRKAKFFNQTMKCGGKEIDICDAKHTKVESGLDRFGCEKVKGTVEWVGKRLECTLSTG